MLERVLKKLELKCQFWGQQIQKLKICKIQQLFVSKTKQIFNLWKKITLKDSFLKKRNATH